MAMQQHGHLSLDISDEASDTTISVLLPPKIDNLLTCADIIAINTIAKEHKKRDQQSDDMTTQQSALVGGVDGGLAAYKGIGIAPDAKPVALARSRSATGGATRCRSTRVPYTSAARAGGRCGH